MNIETSIVGIDTSLVLRFPSEELFSALDESEDPDETLLITKTGQGNWFIGDNFGEFMVMADGYKLESDYQITNDTSAEVSCSEIIDAREESIANGYVEITVKRKGLFS
ncbi:hypothetical protein [Vibrio crassostreae]|uniref:hypothetical protein n=1 Tax=Vibrio crassostreae TaxID=246167 RepID=UPI001B30FBC5|nr:hypothetical protein [Vibrio crassostreae]